jgi:predicted acetyltransferase
MYGIVPQVSLSDIDTERFGILSARAVNVTCDTLQYVLEYCQSNNVKFLIARCDSDNMKAVQTMESNGFLLTDTLLYYRCDLIAAVAIQSPVDIVVRPIRFGEATTVREIALEAFQGYMGHYHADPRLDPTACDETYASWAHLSCTVKDVADEVLVAEQDGSLTGFLSLKLNIASKEGTFVLNGVRPSAQGSGVYSALVSFGKERCLQDGLLSVITSTHLPNTAVQKVWTRQGFWLTHAYYTFHKWFD